MNCVPIPVADRLPEVTVPVLLWDGNEWVIGYLVDYPYWKVDGSMEYSPPVSHWLPLPEKPHTIPTNMFSEQLP